MCPKDDSHLTVEFDDHYVITPSIKFINVDIDYTKNKINEEGCRVEYGFEYHSGENPHFLTIDELKSFNNAC